MAFARNLVQSSRLLARPARTFTSSAFRSADNVNKRKNDTQEAYEKIQKERALNPHMTNTNSTIANEMPSVGADKVPPELISSIDPDHVPKDSVPENTDRMTGGTQNPPTDGNDNLQVGEIEGGSFKVEPLRRTGEDDNTMRARLLYQSRKRGTLESDLLLSTFADTWLGQLSRPQLEAYDTFLDENDWDIYYWATQEPSPTSLAYAEGAGPNLAAPEAQGKALGGEERAPDGGPKSQTDGWRVGKPRSGEWAQTVGTFKPAYRPVPKRWEGSEILTLLRQHVEHRSAGGVSEGTPQVNAASHDTSVQGTGGGGLGFMPELKNFDR